MVVFISPAFDAFTSGGNIFNHQIYLAIKEKNYEVKCTLLELFSSDSIQIDDLLLIDSIYIKELAFNSLKSLSCKKIFICHLLPSMLSKRETDIKYEFGILKIFDSIIVNSDFTKDYVQKNLKLNHTKTLLPYIENLAFADLGKKKIGALIVCNILPNKQIDKFIISLSKKKTTEIETISIVGSICMDAKYYEYCNRLVMENQLSEKIKFLGAQNRTYINQLLHESAVYLDISSFETYGISVAEALLSGIPILSLGSGNVQYLVPKECTCPTMDDLVKRFINKDWIANSGFSPMIISDWEVFCKQFDFI